jgi:3'-phosphoadenosine 5'-phosphosulfate (PAPS) 3'-phosphatase
VYGMAQDKGTTISCHFGWIYFGLSLSTDSHLYFTKYKQLSSLIYGKMTLYKEQKFCIIKYVLFRGIRALGSAACNICAVARGQADAYYETGMHIWDICASGLILTEAGGVMKNTKGEEINLLNRQVLVSSTLELSKEISSRLTQINVEPDGQML